MCGSRYKFNCNAALAKIVAHSPKAVPRKLNLARHFQRQRQLRPPEGGQYKFKCNGRSWRSEDRYNFQCKEPARHRCNKFKRKFKGWRSKDRRYEIPLQWVGVSASCPRRRVRGFGR